MRDWDVAAHGRALVGQSLFFSFLFCRVTIESRSICAESRSILSSVEHGTFFGRFLCHSCHIRHRIRDPGYHRRGGGNRAWDSKRSDAGRDARRGRAMGARLWRHTPLTAFDRGRAASRVVSFELGVEVDHADPSGGTTRHGKARRVIAHRRAREEAAPEGHAHGVVHAKEVLLA